MDSLLGVDAGATKTVALLTDLAGHPLGRGQGGPGNVHSVGEARAREAVRTAIAAAFVSAGRPQEQAAAMCIGAAGAGRRAEAEAWKVWCLEQVLASRVRVTSDAELVLAAALGNAWCDALALSALHLTRSQRSKGVVIIAGTGSVAFAQRTDGQRTRAGGWGYIIGDEGSAYDIACAALNAVLKAFDGRGPQTALAAVLLTACNVKQPPDLVGYVYGSGVDRHALARLAVHVSQAAKGGDAVAGAILDRAGDELAELAVAAARAAGLWGKVRCGFAGGVLIGSPQVRDRLVAQMAERGLVAEPKILVEEPAWGAIWIARSLAHPPGNDNIVSGLRRNPTKPANR